ncbi:MAG: carboxypeptidase-like regulatory domain-containing protein [Saprospiraceae bacterium]|nr:carboxypeptidase-like regulatory domain-containing protein [Saprospiraceae bacterium]
MYKLLTFSVFILLTYSISAQNMLNGSVIDNTTGEPIIGANLTIKDTGQGTTTDFDGKYSFSSSKSFPWTIIVSYIGYETKSIIADGKTELNIRLSSDAELLDEVVVSASRKAEKKQESPSAISVLSGKNLH